MKIILLRTTKKNAFLMVSHGDGLKNLTVPNDAVGLTGLSERVFGRPDPNDENSHVGEYFIQYRIEIPSTQNEDTYDDGRIIQIIHKIPYDQFLSQGQYYIEGKNCWTPRFKFLRIGWITPF